MDVIVKTAQKFNVPTDYLLDNNHKANIVNKKIPKDLRKIFEKEEMTLNVWYQKWKRNKCYAY